MKRIERIHAHYTRKLRINLLLPVVGKEITDIQLLSNTRYFFPNPV